ncbi:uncharacterized protein ACLA_017190 [Aspergillus clavatus NRRL 1]|uniref:Uncharacterized protein n=1 Tax=Aspergillus clavatus (strain ATCC 1007 / CBS 513.65 / DSM 816 / NCTC 3887 / NRRL 1 / QM 1276 / 107) TaxID=344612 RepID=A1CC04_ASPCL|nr:uncharacterized protein ACLA_017190 [Aspergillus clavatus NRRL 1]EAW13272.1 hypothetical protein ACLA_017190 [Aspergillus clavatus NRRL 1]
MSSAEDCINASATHTPGVSEQGKRSAADKDKPQLGEGPQDVSDVICSLALFYIPEWEMMDHLGNEHDWLRTSSIE